MSTILVTGAAGFIGTNFVRHVAKKPGCNLIALNRGHARQVMNLAGVPNVKLVDGQIGDEDLVGQLLTDHKVDVVVNFAAETHVDRSIDGPAPFIESNVVQLQRLLEAVRHYGGSKCLFVQASTDEVYGDRDRKFASKEHDVLVPSSPYSASKAASEHLVTAYGRTYGLRWLITRSANNYGPYQLPEKFVPLCINRAIDGFNIPIYGDGMQRRDWIHVDDNCEAIWVLVKSGFENRAFNIGVGRSVTNLQMVNYILGLIKSSSTVEFVTDRPGHDRAYSLDVMDIRARGWYPRVDLQDGLRNTIRWYKEHVSWVAAVIAQGYTTRRVGLGNKPKEPEHAAQHDESHHLGRREGDTVVSDNADNQQTAAPGVRQADDLLPADNADAGGGKAVPDHLGA